MSKWNGGHGPMTVISQYEIEQKVMDDIKNLKKQFRGGFEFGCSKCGEAYKAHKEHSIEEISGLQTWLAKGGCPYCNQGTMPYYIRLQKAHMQYADIPHDFQVGDKIYHVLRQGRK